MSVQSRATLGLAWERVEKAVPPGTTLTIYPPVPGSEWTAGTETRIRSGRGKAKYERRAGEGPTLAAALNALANALESRT